MNRISSYEQTLDLYPDDQYKALMVWLSRISCSGKIEHLRVTSVTLPSFNVRKKIEELNETFPQCDAELFVLEDGSVTVMCPRTLEDCPAAAHMVLQGENVNTEQTED